MVQDLEGFCDALNLESVIAAGHSLGGEVLTLAAEQSPGFFERLVLLEPEVVVDQPTDLTESPWYNRRRRTWGSREELHAYLQQHPTVGRWRDDVILDVVNHETRELPDGRIDMKWSPDTMNHDEAHRECEDLKPVFRVLNMPMLFIVSELRESNFRDLPSLASEMPNFNLTTVKNTDHNMYMERPDAVASLIANFAADRAIPEVI
jgi:pimeloyl-ACP methyl ester carboxylesterase